MACSTSLVSLTMDCSASKGGIRKCWIGSYAENAFSFSTDETTGLRAAVTGTSESIDWKEFEFKKNVNSFTSTLNIDNANGYNYVSTEISLQFTKMETSKRIAIAALAVADAVVVIEDANGELWAFGADSPVNATGGSAQTGASTQDGNFYQITLTDESDSYPCMFTSEAKTAFLNKVNA